MSARRFSPALIAAAVAAASVGGFVYARYAAAIRVERARVGTGSQIAKTPCGAIEYAVRGSGPPVLVVHGAGGGYDQALDFAEPLERNGFRVVAMSRFGYLRTPLPADASAVVQADAHACLMDALGIGRAAIIGASAGAPSAMQFALRYPARCSALVLLVPATYVPRRDNAPSMKTPAGTQILFDVALRSDFLFWLAPRIARSLVIRALLATPSSVVTRASTAEQERVARVIDHILPVAPRRPGLLNDASVTSSLERYDLERIAAPVLVISVDDDLFGTIDAARYTAQHIAGARLVAYPSGGHLWVGHQDEVVDEIAGFLKQHV